MRAELIVAAMALLACGERESVSEPDPFALPPGALPALGVPRLLHSPAPIARGHFGLEVALDGDTLAVAATHDARSECAGRRCLPGVVYVYDLGARGRPPQRLTADGGGDEDSFGESLAIDGGVLAIGVPGAGSSPIIGGYVHVYRRAADGTWAREAVLRGGLPPARFGTAVAVDGETIVVGAPSIRPAGEVHVFTRVEGSWTRTAELTGATEPSADYGSRLALGPDVLAVAAPREWVRTPSGAQRTAGSVYLHARRGASFGAAVPVRPPNLERAGTFGRSLAVDASTLIIGDPHDRAEDGVGSGAVHVYRRTGTAVERIDVLTPGTRVPCESFGAAVALAGPTLLASAPLVISTECPRQEPTPSIRRFERHGARWIPGDRLDPTAIDVRFFASSLVRSGRRVAAGSIWANATALGGVPIGNAGAVYLYEAR